MYHAVTALPDLRIVALRRDSIALTSDIKAPKLFQLQRALETSGITIIDADGTMGAGGGLCQP